MVPSAPSGWPVLAPPDDGTVIPDDGAPADEEGGDAVPVLADGAAEWGAADPGAASPDTADPATVDEQAAVRAASRTAATNGRGASRRCGDRAMAERYKEPGSDPGWHDRFPAVGRRRPTSEPTGGHVRTVLRYLGGAALVTVLIAVGVVLRILQVAGSDQRATADAIVVLG